MKHFLALSYIGIIVLFGCNSAMCQPGMYAESDIEYQTLFIEAQHAKYSGDSDEQISLLNKLIKRNKQSHAAHFELAKTYTLLGDSELALKNAEKAHALAPTNEWYLLRLAEIYEKSDQQAAAITAYGKLKMINPQNPTIYHKLAQLQLHEKDVDGAIASLELLQSIQGVEEETSRRIFEMHKAAGNKKKAIAALRKLITAQPDNTRYLGNLASYYKQLGDEKNATKVYEEILEIDPTDAQATLVVAKSKVTNTKGNKSTSQLSNLTPILANANLSLDDKIQELMPYVSTMEQAGATTDELDLISEKLTVEYPHEAKVYSLRGDILFYQAKFESAEKSYKKALGLDDSKYVLWQQYLQTLWELENYAAMIKVSEEAIDLYPNQVAPFLYHALSLSKGKKSGAEDYVTEAGFIAGKNELLRTQIALVTQWLDLAKATKAEVATIDLKKISNPIYFELAGDIYAALKDIGTANKLYKEAIKLGSDASRFNFN